MSSMMSEVSSVSSELETQLTNADGGLDVTGQRDEENIIELDGNADNGIIGGNLNDIITTSVGEDVIFSDDGDDVIMAGMGDDLIRGGEGDDILEGGPGADKIRGGEGNDIIRGGLGGVNEDGEPTGDTLFGGSGADVFEFSVKEFEDGAIDKIMDFKADGFDDTIKIFGVGEEDDVAYDPETGFISINGSEAIYIGEDNISGVGLNPRPDGTDTFELF